MTEQQLREQLRKISALYEGATTPGERSAAAAAIERVKKAIAAIAQTEQPSEFQFTLPDLWQRRLFSALCRRYGLEPFRYKRQRYTTVVLRAPTGSSAKRFMAISMKAGHVKMISTLPLAHRGPGNEGNRIACRRPKSLP